MFGQRRRTTLRTPLVDFTQLARNVGRPVRATATVDINEPECLGARSGGFQAKSESEVAVSITESGKGTEKRSFAAIWGVR